MRKFATFLAFSMPLVACGSNSPTASEQGSFEIESIVKVSQFGCEGPRRATIHSDAGWAEAW